MQTNEWHLKFDRYEVSILIPDNPKKGTSLEHTYK